MYKCFELFCTTLYFISWITHICMVSLSVSCSFVLSINLSRNSVLQNSLVNCPRLDINVGHWVKLTNIVTYLLATLGSGATDPPSPARWLSSNSLSPDQVYLQCVAKSTSSSAEDGSLRPEVIRIRFDFFFTSSSLFLLSSASPSAFLPNCWSSRPTAIQHHHEIQRQQPSIDTFTSSCNRMRSNLYNKGLFHVTRMVLLSCVNSMSFWKVKSTNQKDLMLGTDIANQRKLRALCYSKINSKYWFNQRLH